MPIAESIRYFGVGPTGLTVQDIRLLALVIPTLKARELLDTMKLVDSSTISKIVFTAYGDEKLASQVENTMLLNEQAQRSRK